MKNAWWVGSSVGVLIAVGAVIGGGVWVNHSGFGLDHPEPMSVEMPEQLFSSAIDPDALEAPDFATLEKDLTSQAADSRLGTFVGVARDVESGEVVWEQNQGTAVRPASATKILTAAVALYELGREDTIKTEVVEGEQPGTVVIKAGGDVTLSEEMLDDLATQLDGQDIGKIGRAHV